MFIAVNVIWDILSPRTGSFHIEKMREKTSTLHNATVFCTSLLMLLTIFEPSVWTLAKETYVPIILAGGSAALGC